MKRSLLLLALLTVTTNAVATERKGGLFFDYQGLEKKDRTYKEIRKERGIPDGFNLFTDKHRGLMTFIGEPQNVTKESYSFGDDESLKLALSFIIPEDWFVYAEDSFKEPNVSWEGNGQSWLDVLFQISVDNGLKWIIDWDQKIMQVYNDKDFVPPDVDNPVTLEDPETGKTFFIYSEQRASARKGFLLVNGEKVPVVVN